MEETAAGESWFTTSVSASGTIDADAIVETIATAPLDFPRINYRAHNGRPYRYAYGAGATEDQVPLATVTKVDVEQGEATVWAREDCFPGEPVFIPAPDGTAEDDGVLLSVVFDALRGSSFLLVLDAATMEELARAQAPHRVPFGFHGSWFS